MSINRLFAAFVVLSLLLVGAFTVRSAVATTGLVSADRTYDVVEHLRAQRDSLAAVDHSYDQVEHIRSQRGTAADRTYDEIERIRSQRGD